MIISQKVYFLNNNIKDYKNNYCKVKENYNKKDR